MRQFLIRTATLIATTIRDKKGVIYVFVPTKGVIWPLGGGADMMINTEVAMHELSLAGFT